MSKVFRNVVIGFALTTVTIIGVNEASVLLSRRYGKAHANVSREIYKESNSYIEGMIQDLADAKREYDRTDDKNEKQQILEFVNSKFSNFDMNKITDDNLYRFLLEARK